MLSEAFTTLIPPGLAAELGDASHPPDRSWAALGRRGVTQGWGNDVTVSLKLGQASDWGHSSPLWPT